MVDSMYYGIFTDSSRIEGEKLKPKPNNNGDDDTSIETSSTSIAFIAIIIVLGIYAVVIPTVAIILDKKDYKAASSDMTSKSQIKLLEMIAKLSNEPVSYWIFKQDDVSNYSIASKSIFSHILT